MNNQSSFFQTEDTPLFSGTPQRAKESIFKPQEVHRQEVLTITCKDCGTVVRVPDCVFPGYWQSLSECCKQWASSVKVEEVQPSPTLKYQPDNDPALWNKTALERKAEAKQKAEAQALDSMMDPDHWAKEKVEEYTADVAWYVNEGVTLERAVELVRESAPSFGAKYWSQVLENTKDMRTTP